MIKLFYNLLFPRFNYAEMHHRFFPGFPSVIYRSYPEIIADVPHRFQGNSLPVFLLVKDAHRFPIRVDSLFLIYEDKKIEITTSPIVIKEKWFWNYYEIKHPFFIYDSSRELHSFFIEISFTNLSSQKQHRVVNDSYPGKKKKPFRVYPSDWDLPGKKECWWGDIHSHSQFTEDPIEFGSPVSYLHKAADTTGLDFAFITDHSYDLDDQTDNCLINDPAHPKFKEMRRQTEDLPSPPLFLHGEEVSWGNNKRENIHALILNPQKLYEGFGDSGERYIQNEPTHFLSEEIDNTDPEKELVMAAHPLKRMNRSQKLLLNRGRWGSKDLYHPSVHSWQILNGKLDRGFLQGQQQWIKALLAGKKTFITAGNDSHGNLNIFRQMKTPFISIENNYNHQFGYFKTGLIHLQAPLTRGNILRLIRDGRMIISSGPFASFSAKDVGKPYQIGDTIPGTYGNTKLNLHIRFISTPEFGSLFELSLKHGNISNNNEKTIFSYENNPEKDIFEYNHSMEFDSANEPGTGYLRLEAKTGTGHFVLTNPIWCQV